MGRYQPSNSWLKKLKIATFIQGNFNLKEGNEWLFIHVNEVYESQNLFYVECFSASFPGMLFTGLTSLHGVQKPLF